MPLKYLKIFIEQQITDHRWFIACMSDEIRTSMNLISQLNALIAKLEASGDYEEVFNLVMELLDDRCHIPPRQKREARRERESSQHIGVRRELKTSNKKYKVLSNSSLPHTSNLNIQLLLP
ncbi:hypothetical protein Tco_0210423 [Tanacetum coccineum]